MQTVLALIFCFSSLNPVSCFKEFETKIYCILHIAVVNLHLKLILEQQIDKWNNNTRIE